MPQKLRTRTILLTHASRSVQIPRSVIAQCTPSCHSLTLQLLKLDIARGAHCALLRPAFRSHTLTLPIAISLAALTVLTIACLLSHCSLELCSAPCGCYSHCTMCFLSHSCCSLLTHKSFKNCVSRFQTISAHVPAPLALLPQAPVIAKVRARPNSGCLVVEGGVQGA